MGKDLAEASPAQVTLQLPKASDQAIAAIALDALKWHLKPGRAEAEARPFREHTGAVAACFVLSWPCWSWPALSRAKSVWDGVDSVEQLAQSDRHLRPIHELGSLVRLADVCHRRPKSTRAVKRWAVATGWS